MFDRKPLDKVTNQNGPHCNLRKANDAACNNKAADQPAHQCRLISAFIIRFLKVKILNFMHARFFIVYLASVAEQTDLTPAWSEIPKTGFLASWPKSYKKDNCELVHNTCNSLVLLHIIAYTVKPALSGLSKRIKIGFEDRLVLNAGQKYCRMLQERIIQYFRSSLSYHLSLMPLFCLFLSDR